ncbi:MAG: M24 family metallopeptidase [Verrucomicrobia bacterium]|nr:M24 family metallopeptidase [Verrucomicrobiota bacterium]
MLDAPERNADLHFASGFWAPDPLIFLATATRGFLCVSALEQGRALAHAKAEPKRRLRIVTAEDLRLRGKRRRSLSEWAVALLRQEGIRRVDVPATFPLAVARRLEARGIAVRVATERLFPARAVKTADELKKITESQVAAVAAMRAAIGCLRAAKIDSGGCLRRGRRRLTSEDVKQVIHATLLAHNTWCRDVIVAGGAQAADPHDRGHGPLRAGEAIVLDIFPQHMGHGYWGDLTRTVVRGKASPALKRRYAAVKAAQVAALAAIRPGAACAKVHGAAAATLSQRGFVTEVRDGQPVGFIHSTGHGVGLEIHEAPALAPVAGRLQRGNVVTVEPGLYDPRMGGIRIEDTVAVVRGGWKILEPCPHGFEV